MRIQDHPQPPPVVVSAARQHRASERAFLRAFGPAARAMLGRLGATPLDDGGAYDLRLDTRAGELRLVVYEDWLAARFTDVERAKALLNPCNRPGDRLNPYSGKWNFHFWPEHGAEAAVAYVESHLRQILGPQP